MEQTTQAEQKRARPFYCGTQFLDWQEANCCRCTKFSFQLDPATGKTRAPLDEDQVCQIELALYEAHCDDGTVAEDIGRRMGYRAEEFKYNWPCGEFDPVEAVRP